MSQASAADRKSIRAQEKAAKIADAERASVLQTLMFTPIGRRYIWDQLTACHIFEANTIESVRLSAMWDGERNAGLRLLNDIIAFTPDQFILAMRESNERRDSDNRSASPRSSEGAGAEQYSGSSPTGRDAEGSIDILGGDDYDPYRTEDA